MMNDTAQQLKTIAYRSGIHPLLLGTLSLILLMAIAYFAGYSLGHYFADLLS